MHNIVIVGSGIAASTAAGVLRAEGFTGKLTVVGDEFHAPYSRPPLSKAVLENAETLDSVLLAELPVNTKLISGTAAVGLDMQENSVTLADGRVLHFDGLIIASGARARVLNPSGPKENLLRGIDDAINIKHKLASSKTVLVIGGGFLGMEIASTMQKLGKKVTVIDIFTPLERQFGKYLAEKMTQIAMQRGVEMRVEPEGIETIGNTEIEGVRTTNGEEIFADLVITAVGDVPNVEWLESAGLADEQGLKVNSKCQVTPKVVAAGDVVRVNDNRRTPHWGAAVDQARIAATNLINPDDARDYIPAPYFWTEQWDLDIKICGSIPHDVEPEIIEGSWEENSLILQYRANGIPVASATINRRYPIFKLRKLAQPETVRV